jgi:dTDP-4-dehydrorhamnose reductase
MNVLITGGTGLLGQAIVATAGDGARLCVLHRRNYRSSSDGVEEIVLDVLDQPRLAELFTARRFDVVVHAAGMASVDEVERRPEEAWRSNVVGTQNVAELARKSDSRLIYVSSNAVFDGRHAPYRETDDTNPVNTYGRIKVECETLVRRTCPDAAIVRPILMYGWHRPEGRANPATWLLDRLRRGETTHLVTDVYENPLWSLHCGEVIWRVIGLAKGGLFHVAGRDVVNRYELGRLVAQVFDLDASLLHPVDSSFFPSLAPRPRNTSFVTERMHDELGIASLPLQEGLRRMRALGDLAVGSHPGDPR